jgi:transcriptional regulator with GAF, ATPase, and Fis domain
MKPAINIIEKVISPGNGSQGKREKNLILFRKIQDAMTFLPDFEATCKTILESLMGEIDAENCSIMIRDPLTDKLKVKAVKGKNDLKSKFYHSDDLNGHGFQAGEGIAGLVVQHGKSILIDDAQIDPRFIRHNGHNSKVRSLICYPIRENEQIVGVINLSHSKKGAFHELDKLAIAYVSNQVGAALTTARYFIDVEDLNKMVKHLPEPAAVAGGSVFKEDPQFPTFMEVGELTNGNGIFLYSNEKMQQIKEIIDQVANTDVTVLIQGESGVGKEVVARSIHQNSFRSDRPFVKVNCAALPEELLESELFGYEKGAFTGAYRRKLGKFELAEGGTIFLDEIAEIGLGLQAKLLQVIQDREFCRLGGKKDIRVNVRVLAATNKDLEKAAKNGTFREDLFYRLNVVRIIVPPLRERKEEIPIFIEYFLNKYRNKYNKKAPPFSGKVMEVLLQGQWPGNVRELENMIQRHIILGSANIGMEDVPNPIKEEKTKGSRGGSSSVPWPTLREVRQKAAIKVESEVIAKALEISRWNRRKTAELLQISYKTLLYKMKECGIQKQQLFGY